MHGYNLRDDDAKEKKLISSILQPQRAAKISHRVTDRV